VLVSVGEVSVAELADTALADGLAHERRGRGWFDVLAALRRSGTPYELNPTELSRAMLLSSGGMTKRLDRLEAAGLVERRPSSARLTGSSASCSPGWSRRGTTSFRSLRSSPW
jgi:DNA-binding transcriptional ArsR family regulator